MIIKKIILFFNRGLDYNNLMNPNTIRERILQFLDEHRSASAPEMATAMGVTRANIRYHLAALIEQAKIEVTPDSGAAKNRGRPIYYYHLRADARPNNFANLAGALLHAHFDNLADDVPISIALRQLAAKLLIGFPQKGNLTQRLADLIKLLNRWNYQARWEAHSQSPQILFRGCPYAAILHEHPELCRLDQFLIEHATGNNARQIARVNLITNQPPACVFLLLGGAADASTPQIDDHTPHLTTL